MARIAAAIPLLLLAAGDGAPTPQDRPEALVRELGDDDWEVREEAGRRLFQLGEAAWPALEEARASEDEEVKARAGAVLHAGGWLTPREQAVLNPARLARLRGTDAAARESVVEEILMEGDIGLSALSAALGGRPVEAALETVPGTRTFAYGTVPAVAVSIRNAAGHPGWVPQMDASAEAVAGEAYGRPVAFPIDPGWRCGGGSMTESGFPPDDPWDIHVNTAGSFEWLGPGATGKTAAEAGLPAYAARYPGVYRVRVTGVPRTREVRVHIVEQGVTIIPEKILPVSQPENVRPADATVFVLPGDDAPAAARGASISAGGTDDWVSVSLCGDGDDYAPADFGSAWYVALDGWGEVAAWGPLDGGSTDPREYGVEDLRLLRTSAPITRVFSFEEIPGLRRLPAGRYRLIVGAEVLVDSGPAERVTVSSGPAPFRPLDGFPQQLAAPPITTYIFPSPPTPAFRPE